MSKRGGTEKKKKRSRKSALIVFAILILAIGAGTIVYVRLVVTGKQSTDDAVIAGNQVVVSAQMLGRITSMAVDEGDRVGSGETLVTLDDRTLKAQQSQAQANVVYAVQSVTLAQVKLDQAQSDLSRAAVQVQNNIIPQEQYDHLKAALAAAEANYNIAVAQQQLAQTEVGTVTTNLEQTIIRSPIDGIAARKWAMPGDVVQPAQSIYTLYDLDHVWVQANFKETQLVSLRDGESAKITVDSFPGQTFTGKVEDIGAVTASQFALIPADNASGNFTKVTQRVPVKISIDERNVELSGRRFLPGMSAEVQVETGKE